MNRYDIYWVNLDPTIGREIKKTRPCVIVSPDIMNNALDTVQVVPITSTIIDWPFRTSVALNGQASSVACDQLRTVAKERLQNKVGTLSAKERREVIGILQEIFAE